MRIQVLAILAIAMISASAPARAQTYGSDYPVCLRVYGPASYYECRYTSLEQCNLSASGRSAQCVLNPYASNAYQDRLVRRRGVY
jgi:hypothetical protein